MLRVPGGPSIPLDQLTWRFDTSGGPGGQHANKAATRAEVRFEIASSPYLNDWERERLLARFGNELRVSVDEHRSQLRNRNAATERLRERLAEALVVERPRRPTKPGKAAKKRRVDDKRRRGEIKQHRQRPNADD